MKSRVRKKQVIKWDFCISKKDIINDTAKKKKKKHVLISGQLQTEWSRK